MDLNKCTELKGYTECYINLALSNYNNQNINYYFTVEDIVGNKDSSRSYNILVDTSPPVINNPDSFVQKSGRYIYFDIDITETNFDEATYSYIDNRGRLKEKRICSSLKNGRCIRKVTFNDEYDYQKIKVLDEAGNSVEKEIVIV